MCRHVVGLILIGEQCQMNITTPIFALDMAHWRHGRPIMLSHIYMVHHKIHTYYKYKSARGIDIIYLLNLATRFAY